MTLQAPKNDAARKAWLCSLKDGDEVAWVGCGDPAIVKIQLFNRRQCFGAETYRATFSFPTGKRAGLLQWIVPVTEQHRHQAKAKHARERIIGAMSSSGLREFSDEQILQVAAVLWSAKEALPEEPFDSGPCSQTGINGVDNFSKEPK